VLHQCFFGAKVHSAGAYGSPRAPAAMVPAAIVLPLRIQRGKIPLGQLLVHDGARRHAVSTTTTKAGPQ